MATRKGINISGHYVVQINVERIFTYFVFLKIERSDRIIVLSIVFKTQRPSDTVFSFRVTTSNSSQRL